MEIERDVAVIGAGPAGLRAAEYLAHKGLRVIVLDEYFRAGGRLLGQRYETPKNRPHERVWNGEQLADELAARVRQEGVDLLTGVSVWNLAPCWHLDLYGGPYTGIHAHAVLIATGAVERAIPIPGWTLPGVISIGAAQTLTNLHRVRPGKRVMVVGMDPLALSITQEMKRAGVDVVGIALPPPGAAAGEMALPAAVIGRLAQVASMAPGVGLHLAARLFGGRWRRLGAILAGFEVVSVWGIPLHLRKAVMRINGQEQVESVVLARIGVNGAVGRMEPALPVDAVCISGGLYPLSDLVALAGCPLLYLPEMGGQVPLHALDMRTPVAGIFVAGNVTGVEGAEVAMAQGTVAGVSIACYCGVPGIDAASEFALAQSSLRQARAGAALKFYPAIEVGRARMANYWAEYEKRQAETLPPSFSARSIEEGEAR
jgi:sarcosine oxidase subunit alpha